jgi:recombinational DNA repair ATPase RecF
MLRTVEFRNFKALRHVKIDLERFTVLVGPNASGKTSILEGVYYLSRPQNQMVQPTVVPWEESFFNAWTRGANEPVEITLEADEGVRRVVLSPPDTHLLSSSLSRNAGWQYQALKSLFQKGVFA